MLRPLWQVDGAFSLGVGTARLAPAAAACPGGVLAASAPFGVPCTFREGTGLQRGEAARKRHSALWAAAMALLRAVDPDYVPTSIGFVRPDAARLRAEERERARAEKTCSAAAARSLLLTHPPLPNAAICHPLLALAQNRNFRGSPHRDEKDAGPQVATALSAALRGGRGYVGGELRVYSPHGAVDVDTQNGWCRFDGRYKHEVMPFRSAAGGKKAGGKKANCGADAAGALGEQGADGVRYSVIFYQLTPPFAVDMSTVILASE